MKDSLLHLPETKQEQINAIVESIKAVINPEKIILFGSYAKGTYVEDKYLENGITYEYLSDYDFLVVTKDGTLKEHIISDKIINRFHFHTPINIISHDIDYVNQGLSFGQYFFTDIIKEGILLHDNGEFEFKEAKILTPEEEKQKAQDYFDIWFPIANEFLIDGENGFLRGSYKKSAFELHQACENFYNAVLLVFTGYKPKTHNLDKLRSYTKNLSKDLYSVFLYPKSDSREKHLFELLKRGYIDARYKQDYDITGEEAELLLFKVQKFKEIVRDISMKKISQFIKD